MKPEEKAKELVEKFMGDIKNYFNYGTNEHDLAIVSALICVDEIMDFIKNKFIPNADAISYMHDSDYLFYEKVKAQINKL